MATLSEISSLAGGVARGAPVGQAMKIGGQEAARKNEQADRERRAYNAAQALNEWLSKRGEIDMPDPVEPIPTNQAIPVAGAPAGSPVAGGGGGSALPSSPAAAATTGTPTTAPAMSATQQQGPRRTRRERYQDWRAKGEELALLAGGMQGLDAFRKQEDFYNHQQTYHHAREAMMALARPDAVEAARQLNSAMEVTPTDPGVTWEAENGQLYAKGRDGSRSGPFTQEHVQGLMEKYLATTEDYLAFQELGLAREKQAESERAAKANEALLGRQMGVAERRIALEEELGPRDTQAGEARALAALMQAKAANARAAQLGARNGWTNDQLLKIMDKADDWYMDVATLLPGAQEAFNDDPEQRGLFVSDVQNQMTSNAPGQVTRDEAAFVSQMLRQPEGIDLSKYTDRERLQFGQTDTGAVVVNYNGKTWALPSELGLLALQRLGRTSALPPPEGGGGKEELTSTPGAEALPTTPQTDEEIAAGFPAAWGVTPEKLQQGRQRRKERQRTREVLSAKFGKAPDM